MRYFILFSVFSLGMAFFPCTINASFPATGAILHSVRCEVQPLEVPTWQFPETGEGDILIDNFEYWDSPYNHGWRQIEPYYPVFGFGRGYAIVFNTMLDLSQGNRVLDAYCPTSIYLLNTPYEKHGIYIDLHTPPTKDSSGIDYIDLTKRPIISFKFNAPFGIEQWDLFEFDIVVKTKADYTMSIRIMPIQPPKWSSPFGGNSTNEMGGYLSRVVDAQISRGSMVIEVDIGRNYNGGGWHVVWLDLQEVVQSALDNYDNDFGRLDKQDWEIVKATKIIARGRMFRLDNICFRLSDHLRIDQPDFFECGPLFAQLFEPIRYLFMADYEAHSNLKIKMFSDLLLKPENFITDQEKIRETWISDLLKLDPNYHVLDSSHPQYDPNFTYRWIPGHPDFGNPDPVAERYIRKGFYIDSTLPLFANRDFRIGGSKRVEILNYGMLGWNVTIGGFGSNAIQTFIIKPLPIDPYDGMPTYIPGYYRTIEMIRAYGKNHYTPPQTLTLESALWNVGVRYWPNIAYIDYEPQYFEDLIITLQVTNGHNHDVRTLPITVVNYPVENYPPVVQLHVTNRVTTAGQKDDYSIRFIDPDCFIFSLAQFRGRAPSTTHLPMVSGNKIRTDQEHLTYRMTLNGLPAYRFGPWVESIIDPHNGLISLIPFFEGAFEAIVFCTDPYGGSAFGRFTYYSFNAGTWVNHRPVNWGDPTRPMIIRAGEELILNYPDFKVSDPDGDEMFATSNIGAVGRTADGGFAWAFETNFPGTYHVQIIFYDERGGYIVRRLTVFVRPWWSF